MKNQIFGWTGHFMILVLIHRFSKVAMTNILINNVTHLNIDLSVVSRECLLSAMFIRTILLVSPRLFWLFSEVCLNLILSMRASIAMMKECREDSLVSKHLITSISLFIYWLSSNYFFFSFLREGKTSIYQQSKKKTSFKFTSLL